MIFQINNLHITSSIYYELAEAHYAIKDITEKIHVNGNLVTDKYYAIICETCKGLLGITIEGFGSLTPSMCFKDHYLIIGCALKLCFIDLETKKQICEYDTDPFFQFVSSSNDSIIIVIHEIGVTAYNIRGSKLWDFESPDIIVAWKVLEDGIFLTLLEGAELTIDRQNGLLCAPPPKPFHLP